MLRIAISSWRIFCFLWKQSVPVNKQRKWTHCALTRNLVRNLQKSARMIVVAGSSDRNGKREEANLECTKVLSGLHSQHSWTWEKKTINNTTNKIRFGKRPGITVLATEWRGGFFFKDITDSWQFQHVKLIHDISNSDAILEIWFFYWELIPSWGINFSQRSNW